MVKNITVVAKLGIHYGGRGGARVEVWRPVVRIQVLGDKVTVAWPRVVAARVVASGRTRDELGRES